jgi:hypothetical protein
VRIPCQLYPLLHYTGGRVEPESEDDDWQSATDGDRMSVDTVVDITEPTQARTSILSYESIVLTSK